MKYIRAEEYFSEFLFGTSRSAGVFGTRIVCQAKLTCMTQKNVPFAGGFVLSSRDFGSIAHFGKRALPNGLWWWSDSFVDEDQASAENGDFLIIRGHWASGSEGGKDDPSAYRFLRLAQESIELFEGELDYCLLYTSPSPRD